MVQLLSSTSARKIKEQKKQIWNSTSDQNEAILLKFLSSIVIKKFIIKNHEREKKNEQIKLKRVNVWPKTKLYYWISHH